MEKINWGIVGPGIIAHEFAADFEYVSNGRLVAVASRTQDKAKEFASQYNIPKAYGSYEDLYSDPDIQAIYVATPHSFHHQNTIDALSSGKAVLCEKPLAISPDESMEMIRVAQKHNNYLMEGMWTYFLPAIRKAKEWVDQGRIGKIVNLKSDFGYPVPFDPNNRMYKAELAGGSLYDMGIYTLAMALLFYENEPIRKILLGRFFTKGVDNDVTMLFEYQDAVATLTSAFRCKLPNFTHIIGEEGYIEIPDFWRARKCSFYKLEECIDVFEDGRSSNGFNYEIDAASKDILEGRLQSETVPWATSLKLQQQLYSIKEEINNKT
ncbi:MAG: Gfo/Idh/MocA family oxidoreductase [Cyclobacteriaceae bacterium]